MDCTENVRGIEEWAKQRSEIVKHINFHPLLFSTSLSQWKMLLLQQAGPLAPPQPRAGAAALWAAPLSKASTTTTPVLEPQNHRNGQPAQLSIPLSRHCHTASRNIPKYNFWSRCNLSLTLNLKAPFILFSGEPVQKSTRQIKVREAGHFLPWLLHDEGQWQVAPVLLEGSDPTQSVLAENLYRVIKATSFPHHNPNTPFK